MNIHEARTKLNKALDDNFREYSSPTRERIKLEQELRAAEKFVEVVKEYLYD